MTDLEIEDIKKVAELSYNWDLLSESTLLISGGTGFIGTFFCNVIRYRNQKYKQNIKVISLSRHPRESDSTVTYLAADINKPINIDNEIDYILHLASNTHPEQYKNDPVGTITGNVFGTYNLLALATKKNSKRFALASSCEVYGEGEDSPIDELYSGYINCNTARAGYNESKRVSESLCQSFYKQYGIPSVIFRLSRVFGADRTKNDTKAMAQFVRNVMDGEDIVLKSKGLQRYSYVYIADAVSGIFAVLLNGKNGEAYNIAADYDGMTLGQYAEFIASLNDRNVIFDIEDNPNASQAQYDVLSNAKIKEIGFEPIYSIKQGLRRTFEILKNTCTNNR